MGGTKPLLKCRKSHVSRSYFISSASKTSRARPARPWNHSAPSLVQTTPPRRGGGLFLGASYPAKTQERRQRGGGGGLAHVWPWKPRLLYNEDTPETKTTCRWQTVFSKFENNGLKKKTSVCLRDYSVSIEVSSRPCRPAIINPYDRGENIPKKRTIKIQRACV